MDPLAEQTFEPYSYVGNNPIMFIDPTGMSKDDIIDIAKNDKGEWEITNVQLTEGCDIFRVTDGDKVDTYTFSEGEYGKRFNVLNLENTNNHSLGVYHLSGQDSEGATGFVVTPGGTASAKVGSGKRLPDDTYKLSGTGTGKDQSAYKWVQPLLDTGENSGYVGGRGVKVHPAPSKAAQTRVAQWTEGCYVVSKSYSRQNGQIYFNSKESIETSKQLNTILGSTKNYNGIGNRNRPGSDFGNGIDFKLIQKSGF